MSPEILPPRDQRELLVDGWSVPFIECFEQDGGRVTFTVDRRFGFDVSAADFEQVARLVAYSIAVALGMPCFPQGDENEQWLREAMERVHIALRPRRCMEITSALSETEAS